LANPEGLRDTLRDHFLVRGQLEGVALLAQRLLGRRLQHGIPILQLADPHRLGHLLALLIVGVRRLRQGGFVLLVFERRVVLRVFQLLLDRLRV